MYVRHPKDEIHERWGNGIVLENEKNNQVPVFFEHEAKRVFIGTNQVNLIQIEEPAESTLFLKNALYEDSGDRLPFPIVLKNFLINFEGGLQGELYLTAERNYKLEASQFTQEVLEKQRFQSMIESEDWDNLAADIKRVFSKTNLLASFEMIKLNDALKDVDNIKQIAVIFFELLYGEADVNQRVESSASKLKKFELNKWTVVTYLLFMMYPHKYMFVKPNMTRQAAQNRGFNIQYDSQVNANTHRQILSFAKDIYDRLRRDQRPELHPLDMIDVQGFMWCTFSQGWTKEGIQKAKKQLHKD